MSSVTELLHTKYPLVQAPMNWATDARFVAAVANAGALEVLGPNAGLANRIETVGVNLDHGGLFASRF
ncbi:nitronate monooxygenase [Limosilactobacillus fermentum]|uniref:nitronate monooxygenase n=1 Tax=Limosilactobacillus fermentum TaxID=1613 RepID=UPI0009731471|nr:nitronate monooxygenase [Limosilactobacillus fermentum]MCD5424087.1 nitronate monooxygenase [Limosilactobacillus fermentum]WJD84645.1 nitronate monooxygenase [Limosilactobacillus fermentum]BAW87478.1 enoyl-ACP reductase 2 [Limosilactobacillus fermentum]